MKKGIAWILLLILCLCWTVSLADTSKELTFQDVPWFSSPEEVSKILNESGFITKGFVKKNIATEKKQIRYYHSMIGIDPEDEQCPYKSVWHKKGEPLTQKLELIVILKLPKTIAKVELSGLKLYFTPDSKNPQLVECDIQFKGKNRKNMLPALEEAYGEPTAIKNENYIWLGENNTIVVYDRSEDYVTFATLDGLALAETYDVELPEEPEDVSF